MDELTTIVRFTRPETCAEKAIIRDCANAIREKLHSLQKQNENLAKQTLELLDDAQRKREKLAAEALVWLDDAQRKKERLAAEALLLLHGVP